MSEFFAQLAELVHERARRQAGRLFFELFPEDGKFSRYAYPKAMEFFTLGKRKHYRLLMGGNGTGKSLDGAYETTCHATGRYPAWWDGKVFTNRNMSIWACGEKFSAIRESMQMLLLGPRGEEGTGMIPREDIIDWRYRSAPADSLDSITVRNVRGGESRIVIKSYEEGRKNFQAANVQFIWLDEEPEWSIFSECVQRFRGETAEGSLILTFTPLSGVSNVIMMFVPQFMENFDEIAYEESSRAYVQCSLDDVPHVSAEEKARKIANTQAFEREARINGWPSIGEGRVYPFEEASFIIPQIPGGIPKHWPRLYGLDPGRSVTAAAFGAHDTDDDIVYLWSEHYMKEQLPPVHATAIRARGSWIPGVIDPFAKGLGRSVQDDSLVDVYIDKTKRYGLGLLIREAERQPVAVGINEVYTRLATGRLKVYSTMPHWLSEFRKYSRDKNGLIIKANDDLMDATRHLCMNLKHARAYNDMRDSRAPKLEEVTFGLYGAVQ